MVKIDENLKSELDEQMQEGYKLSMSGKTKLPFQLPILITELFHSTPGW